jgi:hypothetical protein
MGPTPDTAPIILATRFHLDFGFIGALSNDFGVTKGPLIAIFCFGGKFESKGNVFDSSIELSTIDPYCNLTLPSFRFFFEGKTMD